MKAERVREFALRLRREREDLAKVEKRLIRHAKLQEPLDIAITELSKYDNHPADAGSQLFERSKDFGLLLVFQNQRAQIERALQAIKEGTYGYCLHCGGLISEKRLEAMPATAYCVRCQEKREKEDLWRRPVEEEVLFPPFGRTFTDETDSVVFDGEDAWQAVSRYGTSSYTETDDPDQPENGQENGGQPRNIH